MKLVFLSEEGRRRVALATLVCFFAGACVASYPRSGWALSLSEEKELGKKLLEMIKERMPLVEDGEIIAYVQSIGNRIARQVGTTPYQYQFFVINESVPNAFAIPGGYIFVYRGLIELLSSEGELAAILSHELAHVQARHIERRMESGSILNVAMLAGMLAAALIGVAGGGAAAAQSLAMGSMAGSRALELKYSRDNEKEADQLGFRYLCDAGYAPRDMVGSMEKLNRGTWRAGSKVPSYLLTHPALGERILYLADMAEAKGKATVKVLRSNTLDDFPIMQAALFADYSDGDAARERFAGELSKKDGASSAAATYGMGRLCLRQGKNDEALSYLQDAARRASGSPLVLSSLGALYLRQGRLEESLRVLRTALVLDPESTVAHLRLAQALQEMGRGEEALEHLRKIEDLAPTFPEIDLHMGILLGRMSQVGLAHYYLGRYHEQKQDWKLTLFHYQKAKALLKDSPQKQEEIDRVLSDVEKRKKKSDWEGRRSK